MLLAVIGLLGLLAFITWGMVKVGADFDDINEKIWRQIKEREENERGRGNEHIQDNARSSRRE